MLNSAPDRMTGCHGANPRVGTALAFFGPAITDPGQTTAPRDLTQFSIGENLLNVQITWVSKKEQKLSKTRAAVL
jgi:hypothetical protein